MKNRNFRASTRGPAINDVRNKTVRSSDFSTLVVTPHPLQYLGQVVGWPERPVPRAHHSVSYLRQMILVFGGVKADDTILGDLHFYDTLTRRWSGEVAREWCCDER